MTRHWLNFTDTLAESGKVEAVRINSTYAKAVQPFSISRTSEYKYLGRRLKKRIIENKEAFSPSALTLEQTTKTNKRLFSIKHRKSVFHHIMTSETSPPLQPYGRSDSLFYLSMAMIGGSYILLIVLLLLADIAYIFQGSSLHEIVFDNPLVQALRKPEIRFSILLSLISCSLSAIISLFAAVPIGYLLARTQFFGRRFVDALLDIPIILPPLVVGLSLLILFQFWPLTAQIPGIGASLNELVVYQVPAVILAQFAVAAAFAVRTMKATFDQIDPRCEHVALTLGCNRWHAFSLVSLPEARRGMLTAYTLAWARSLGEFGPLLIFAGATRNKTEVLSTTVFLELSIGDIEAAVAASLIMVVAAVAVLLVTRLWGTKDVMV